MVRSVAVGFGSVWFYFWGIEMVKKTEIGGEAPTNGAAHTIEMTQPYTANVTIEGVADILFHRWNVEGIEEKSKAAKGSKAKKTDDIESYIYRDDEGMICLPGEYLRQSIIMAAKFKQDPRSPRKSAFDLMKAAVVSLTPLAPVYRVCNGMASPAKEGNGTASHGKEFFEDWDYEHRCRVQVQRNGITRSRPALKAGWKAEVQLMVTLPEYVSPQLLHELASNAGRLIGVADFRPTYGRFLVSSFDVGFES